MRNGNIKASTDSASVVGQVPTATGVGGQWGWATPAGSGNLLKMTVFTATGANTFTKLAGTNRLLVEVVGGGGSGANNSGGAPTDGGATTFGAYCTGGGGVHGTTTTAGTGGTATGGDLNIPGGDGIKNLATTFYGWGGGTPLGFGGGPATAGKLYGGGGGPDNIVAHGGGGGGGYARKFITSYTNANETVTIGAGGINGAPGAAGVCIVYEYS